MSPEKKAQIERLLGVGEEEEEAPLPYTVLSGPSSGQASAAFTAGFTENEDGEVMFVNPRHAGVGTGLQATEALETTHIAGSGMRIDPNLSPEMQAQVAAALASAQGMMGPPDTTPLAEGLLGGESILYEEQFKNPLEATWEWIRPQEASRDLPFSGPLRIRAEPGGIWEKQSPLAQNFLLRPLLRDCGGVECRMKLQPGSYGEQAGLWWYVSDSSWVKLVIEGKKDGSVAIVLANEEAGVAKVCGQIPLTTPGEWQTLRLEIAASGQLSGMLDNGYCMRMVGEASLPSGTAKVGVGAHGGTTQRYASFEWFRALSIPGDRAHFSRP